MAVQRLRIVDEEPADGQAPLDVVIDGLPDGQTAEPATTDKAGIVKMAASTGVADAQEATTTNVPAVSETPTKAEIDAIVTAYNDLAGKYNTLVASANALVAAMKTAGMLQS